MRTAEEILNPYPYQSKQGAIDAINQARKETIQECANKARVVRVPSLALSQQSELSRILQSSESILSLINELK